MFDGFTSRWSPPHGLQRPEPLVVGSQPRGEVSRARGLRLPYFVSRHAVSVPATAAEADWRQALPAQR